VEAAYEQIIDLSREGRVRREYPEVSYSVVGAIVTGVMGISIEPSAAIADLSPASFNAVAVTRPSLTSANDWVELRNVSLLGGNVSVRHQGTGRTYLTNHGTASLRWKPEFSGSFGSLQIDGSAARAANRSSLSGPVLAGAVVTVAPAKTLQADAK
jgi:hypothetical protein